MSRKRLSLGLSVYALDKVVVSLVQILSVPILANSWGVTTYGIWAIIMTIPSFLALGDFGIVNSAGARMMASIARDEWDEARRTLHTAWLATNAIIAVLLCIAAALIWWLPPGSVPSHGAFDDDQSRKTLMVLLAYGMLTIVFRLNTAAFRATLRYSFASLCSTSVYFAENLAVLLVVILGGDPLLAAIAMLAVRFLWLVGLLVVSRWQLPRLRPGFTSASRTEWAQMWRPALAACALGFGMAGYLQGSVMILGAIAGAATVPAFIAVRTLSRLGVQIATLVSMPVMQEFGSVMARQEVFRGGRYFGLVTAAAFGMATVAALGLVVLGVPFIDFWTQGAIIADPQLLILMAISSSAAMLWNPLSNLILAVNRQRSFSYANLAASIVGLGIIWYLSGRFGAVAAGVSFAFVDSVTLAAVLLFIFRNWHQESQFRAGAWATVRELRSPSSWLRGLRQAT